MTEKGLRRTGYMTERAKKVLDDLGIEVDPKEVVGNLSVGMSQMVEIAKAMEKEAKILVLDEPTASLSDAETKYLFKMMRDLQEKGVSMIYISHSEIARHGDCGQHLYTPGRKDRPYRKNRGYYHGRDHCSYDGRKHRKEI